jgi:hypothetical protein
MRSTLCSTCVALVDKDQLAADATREISTHHQIKLSAAALASRLTEPYIPVLFFGV